MAWGRGRPAQSCHRFFYPAVHLLIHQGPLDSVGGTARGGVGPSLDRGNKGARREVDPGWDGARVQKGGSGRRAGVIMSYQKGCLSSPLGTPPSELSHCVISGGMEAPRNCVSRAGPVLP